MCHADRQTDGRTDMQRQTEGQMNRGMERKTDGMMKRGRNRKMETQTGRQTYQIDRQTDIKLKAPIYFISSDPWQKNIFFNFVVKMINMDNLINTFTQVIDGVAW